MRVNILTCPLKKNALDINTSYCHACKQHIVDFTNLNEAEFEKKLIKTADENIEGFCGIYNSENIKFSLPMRNNKISALNDIHNDKLQQQLLESPNTILVDETLCLSPILLNQIDNEEIQYLEVSKNELLKQYLPAYYPDNQVEAAGLISTFAYKNYFRGGILYALKDSKKQMNLGYINIDSPIMTDSEGFWNLEFWMSNAYLNKGLMTSALSALLENLRIFGVINIIAKINPENEIAIKLIQKFNFKKVNSLNKHISNADKIVYGVKLL